MGRPTHLKDKTLRVVSRGLGRCYFNVTAEEVLRIGRAAAALGVEVLLLDDGWFGQRDARAPLLVVCRVAPAPPLANSRFAVRSGICCHEWGSLLLDRVGLFWGLGVVHGVEPPPRVGGHPHLHPHQA